jgi:hypothetical protein
LPGGFKTRGLRVKGDDTPIAPGEFRDVDVPSGTMRDNILPLPYKEPSQTLMALLQQIITEGRQFANTADLQVSDMSANSPVGTTLAILERTLKVMSAVQARIHYSLKQELKLLKNIIAEYTPEEYDYEPDEGTPRAKKSDYDNCDVIPVSDPNASTMAQKIVQYQAVMQLAAQNPQLFNLQLLNRDMLDVLGIKNAKKLVPMIEDLRPKDPVTENQDILMMKPTKAFAYQNHKAHIAVHMSAMHDPTIQQLLQGNPNAQALQAAMLAHVNEHLGFQYRIDIEQQLGMSLPPQMDEAGEDMEMDPEVEARLAPMLAQAAAQLLQQNQQQAAQAQAQQQQQDPIVQMQQQELQIKQGELQRKVQKDQADIQLKAAQIEVEKNKVALQTKLDGAKAILGVQAKRKDDMLKMGVDLLKDKMAHEHEHKKQNKDLFAKGLDAAHKHTHASNAMEHQASQAEKASKEKKEPKKKGE